MIGAFMPPTAAINALRSISVIASAVSAAASVVAPMDVRKGDILLLMDAPAAASSIGSYSVPPGFTLLAQGPASGWETKCVTSFKVADGTESGATITGMSGPVTDGKVMLQLRGNVMMKGCAVYDHQVSASNGDPGGRTSALSALSPASSPILALGTVQRLGAVAPAFQATTPAFSAQMVGGHLRIGYSVYAVGSPVPDQFVDLFSGGTGGNILTVCGLIFT